MNYIRSNFKCIFKQLSTFQLFGILAVWCFLGNACLVTSIWCDLHYQWKLAICWRDILTMQRMCFENYEWCFVPFSAWWPCLFIFVVFIIFASNAFGIFQFKGRNSKCIQMQQPQINYFNQPNLPHVFILRYVQLRNIVIKLCIMGNWTLGWTIWDDMLALYKPIYLWYWQKYNTNRETWGAHRGTDFADSFYLDTRFSWPIAINHIK